MTRAAIACLALLAGCPGRVAPPPAAPPPVAASGLTVTLLWAAAVDLDLYVTDPARETLYYANPRTASGGALERDVRCAGRRAGPAAERAHWTSPPPGRYRVGVDFPEACEGGVATAAFRLVIDQSGQRRELAGTVRAGERTPDVADFDVGGSPP